jgi:hypothetical protein
MSTEAVPATAVRAQRVAALVICALLAFCLGTGFFVSWDALQVAATAAHASPNATRAYAFCVDGVIAIALAASVVLRHTPGGRRYSLRILAVFSVSSVVLNIAHGLGAFEGPVAWPLLALTAANAPAAIGFGSHLFVKTLQVLFPSMDGTVVHEVVPVPDAAPVPAEDPVPVPAVPLIGAAPMFEQYARSLAAAAAAEQVRDKEDLAPAGKPRRKRAPAKSGPESGRKVDDLTVQKARNLDHEYQTQHGKPIPRDEARKKLGVSNEKTSEALRLAREEVA